MRTQLAGSNCAGWAAPLRGFGSWGMDSEESKEVPGHFQEPLTASAGSEANSLGSRGN